MKLAREADEIYSTKGRKVLHLDLTDKSATDEEILALMLGPTGTLRAPVVRSGKTLIVGYNDDVYEKVLTSA